MASLSKEKQLIGRTEAILLPKITPLHVEARIDTGARTSAIWVSKTEEIDGKLAAVFFGKGHPAYSGKSVFFDSYSLDAVTSSTGHRQIRYKIELNVVICNRKVRAHFTLADRSTQTYPILIGRNVLRGKFIVDVTLSKVAESKLKATG